jgi:hypothetical protein
MFLSTAFPPLEGGWGRSLIIPNVKIFCEPNKSDILNSQNVTHLNNALNDPIAILNPIQDGMLRFTSHVTLDAVSLYDLRGSVLFEQNYFSGSELKLNVSGGIYLLRLNSDEGESTQRVLVR